jgi:hypothetical protein
MGWTIGVLGFDSRQGLGIFLFTTAASRPALGPTQPPFQRVPGVHSLGVKRPGRDDADHAPPSSAEVKNAWNYTSTPPICLYGVVLSLKKAQRQLYLYLISVYNPAKDFEDRFYHWCDQICIT